MGPSGLWTRSHLRHAPHPTHSLLLGLLARETGICRSQPSLLASAAFMRGRVTRQAVGSTHPAWRWQLSAAETPGLSGWPSALHGAGVHSRHAHPLPRPPCIHSWGARKNWLGCVCQSPSWSSPSPPCRALEAHRPPSLLCSHRPPRPLCPPGLPFRGHLAGG